LEPNTTYYYKVSAYNSHGESAQSSSSSATTLQSGGNGSAPSAPTSVAASAESSDTITISWYSVSGANGYRIYRSNSFSGSYYFQGETSYSSYTDEGLDSNTTYYYKVSAYNSYGESAQSSSTSAKTLPSGGNGSAPSAPTSVVAYAESSDRIIVNWYPVSEASGYRVYRSNTSSGDYVLRGEGFDYYEDNGLQPNTIYYYKVSAYNSYGESTQSIIPASATTNPSSSSGDGISNITYSTVSGGEWTVQSDGSRKSPAISDGSLTKSRVSFISGSSNTSITIQLRVSSENYDFAFVSELDTASASPTSGYYIGSRISGTNTVTVTIPVSSPGSHFVDIGYSKDVSLYNGSDCAWFTVIL
jgi:fibronectin type 3 domain-containing protein